jgi:DNA helicase-2/ATP-dependent DNA helicase PcrA
VAAPGSGKTTVAAERFGVMRYLGPRDGRAVLALSFARSARSELAERIRRRWGSSALRWPHEVATLDALHHRLVSHLLRTGDIRWPGGHRELVALDTWRGQSGAHYLVPQFRYRRVAALNGRVVTTGSMPIARGVYGYGQRRPHEEMLAAGYCTHEEVRQILEAALSQAGLRAVLGDYLRTTVKAVIVDEVFDGNQLDLRIVNLIARAGTPTTIIGDPWQALYEFRGAEPELVPRFCQALGFELFQVSESFRFGNDEMRRIARGLRAGEPVAVPPGSVSEADAALASRWESLWAMPSDVLPLAFGQIDNRTDAALALLLEPIVAARFGPMARPAPEAAVLLNLSPETRQDVPDAVAPVLERIAEGTPRAAAAGLDLLRRTMTEMGGRTIRALKQRNEEAAVNLLVALARRLSNSRAIPGMTVHQAKGREWPSVAVHLSTNQLGRLRAGLEQHLSGDREIYVALTRARDRVRLVQLA